MSSPHPALAPPAGLPSGLAHIAHDRWDPIRESFDFTEHVTEHRVRGQVPMPAPSPTAAYSNYDIPHSHPTNRPILACTGLPRAFKVGSRCVNPLEPRYVLPGTSSPSGGTRDGLNSPCASPSPKAGAGLGSEASGAALPSLNRTGSGRLLAPALSAPRSSDAPRLQPLSSPPGSAGQPHGQALRHGHGHAQHGESAPTTPKIPHPGANPNVTTNGAMGGLLLYGPTAPSPIAGASAASPSAGDRCLDVSDINAQRRSSSVPPRRGGFDNLNVTDIQGARKSSPARPLGCLTTGDILGATVRARTHDVASPGRGTLNAADIPGAAPGVLTRPSPTTYALGRWPAPSVPTYHFAHSTRVTLMKKPLAIGARQGES